jgi:tetratricopeptide (TPR) repeat protein
MALSHRHGMVALLLGEYPMAKLGYFATILAAISLAGGAAFASGSGGGGMSESPSASAPAYDPVAEYQKGVAALEASNFKDAERAFNHVLEVAPTDANSLYLLGVAKSGKGDLKGAQKAYEKALKTDATLIPAHRDLAVTDAKLGQADKAKAQRDLLQAQSDTCAGSCPQAADLTAALAAIDAAATPPPAGAAPKPSAALTPPNPLLFTPGAGDRAYVQAVSLINEGRYEDAMAALGAAQTAFGPHPDVLTYMGYTQRKLGRYDRAEGYYKAALAIAPDHRGATEYYGELKVVEGDLPGARRLLAKLETLCPYGCAEVNDLRHWVDTGRQP